MRISEDSDVLHLFIIYHTPKKNARPDSKLGDYMELYFKIKTICAIVGIVAAGCYLVAAIIEWIKRNR